MYVVGRVQGEALNVYFADCLHEQVAARLVGLDLHQSYTANSQSVLQQLRARGLHALLLPGANVERSPRKPMYILTGVFTGKSSCARLLCNQPVVLVSTHRMFPHTDAGAALS